MILCCGEALIDMIPAVTADGQTAFVPHTGGAVFNTSVALGRLGADTGLMSGLSRDVFGTQLAKDLQASNVDTSHVIWSDRPTTLAFVHLRDGHASYSFYDENSAGRMLQPEDLPELSADISTLFFGGISLVCEPAAETYLHLAIRESTDRAVMLDPNIRPAFIQDDQGYRNRLDQMIACADVVKVSDEDLDWILPEAASLEGKAAELQKNGPRIVIVTRGKHGARAFLPDGKVLDVPAQSVQVVDTVGAGDAFNAGFLAHLASSGHLDKRNLRSPSSKVIGDAISFASRVAAITVSRAGANPPWQHELN
jgi:fructokinase